MSTADESAFPTEDYPDNDSEKRWMGGLTKREYAAIHICAALRTTRFNHEDGDDEIAAKEAVAQADALFKALEGT